MGQGFGGVGGQRASGPSPHRIQLCHLLVHQSIYRKLHQTSVSRGFIGHLLHKPDLWNHGQYDWTQRSASLPSLEVKWTQNPNPLIKCDWSFQWISSILKLVRYDPSGLGRIKTFLSFGKFQGPKSLPLGTRDKDQPGYYTTVPQPQEADGSGRGQVSHGRRAAR